MALQAHGPTDHGLMGPWPYGPMAQLAHGLMGLWPYGPMTLQKATAEYECARRSQRVFFYVSKSAAPRPAAVKLVLSGMELPNDYLPNKVRKCVWLRVKIGSQ